MISDTSMNYVDEYPKAISELARALGQGIIKRKFHVVEGGIEQGPVALPLLFTGGNTGKLWVLIPTMQNRGVFMDFRLVKVSDDPDIVKSVL